MIIAANKKAIAELDELVHPVFGERVSKKMIPQARELLADVAKIKIDDVARRF